MEKFNINKLINKENLKNDFIKETHKTLENINEYFQELFFDYINDNIYIFENMTLLYNEITEIITKFIIPIPVLKYKLKCIYTYCYNIFNNIEDSDIELFYSVMEDYIKELFLIALEYEEFEICENLKNCFNIINFVENDIETTKIKIKQEDEKTN